MYLQAAAGRVIDIPWLSNAILPGPTLKSSDNLLMEKIFRSHIQQTDTSERR